MAHIEVNGRLYVKDIDDFAYKQRTMLGIKDSAVALTDTGFRRGYVGLKAKEELIDPITKKNEYDIQFEIPLDFRITGIQTLDHFGISRETQALMFANFMANFTKEQRKVYIDMFVGLDRNNMTVVQQFVNNMIAMLT